MEMGWTLVQRRKYPRKRQNEWHGGSRAWPRTDRGMDRASVPWGVYSPGGPLFTLPNYPPVPPRETAGLGAPRPIPRNYSQRGTEAKHNAEYINLNRNISQKNSKKNSRRNTKYIQPDKHFKNMIHKFHSLIKMLHHEENVKNTEKGNTPKVIQQMIDILSNIIKPAMPNPSIMDEIRDNALEWGYATTHTLEVHYEEEISNLQSQIGQFYQDEWQEPFKVATSWSQKKFPRLQEGTLKKAREMITRAVRERHPTSPPLDPDPELGHHSTQILTSPGPRSQDSLDLSESESSKDMGSQGAQPPVVQDLTIPGKRNTKVTSYRYLSVPTQPNTTHTQEEEETTTVDKNNKKTHHNLTQIQETETTTKDMNTTTIQPKPKRYLPTMKEKQEVERDKRRREEGQDTGGSKGSGTFKWVPRGPSLR